MFLGDKPSPKDFATYEEYKEFLEIHKEFERMSEQASQVISESKTEEELEQKMTELGFIRVEDVPCQNTWCQKNNMCLQVELECLQESYNEYFFGNLLPEDQKLISGELLDAYLEGECRLPQNWYNESTTEGKAIDFLISVDRAMHTDKIQEESFVEAVENEELQKFMRSVYLFTLAVVQEKEPRQKEMGEIEKFLGENTVLQKKSSEVLLKKLNESIG